MHREALICLFRRKRLPGHQVVLIGCEHHSSPEHAEERRLPFINDLDDPIGFIGCVQPHRRFGVELRQAERHNSHGLELRKPIEHTRQGVVEHVTIVDARTHDDLATDFDPVVEECSKPAQTHPAARILQHPVPDVVVGCVNRHVQRRQSLGNDPFQIGFGEAGKGREVAVEKAQPIVIVLEIQTSTHALRKLIDEAKLAVVVARANTIKHC